jgi:2'-5' RNA ligase
MDLLWNDVPGSARHARRCDQEIMPKQTSLVDLYDSLWSEASMELAAGRVRLDPHLRDRGGDRRTGLTVLARPGKAVTAGVARMLRRLDASAPGQHLYRESELHITVLSLFTATANFGPHLARADDYRRAVAEALSGARAFRVRFQGVTATREAVLVQGFPLDGELERLRNRLRAALRNHELGGDIDSRYRIRTAHLTALRFKTELLDAPGFVADLEGWRQVDFGLAGVDHLYLVKNDWYMTSELVEELDSYRMETASPGT